MSIGWDLKPLRDFTDRVKKVDLDKLAGQSTIALFNALRLEIGGKYLGASVEKTDLKHIGNSYITTVTVTAEDLWFREFGTGYIGEKYDYPGDLPEQQLTFFSMGETQTTHGWEYMYHPFTKQHKYWIFDGQRQFGHIAEAGIFTSVNRVNTDALALVKFYLSTRGD